MKQRDDPMGCDADIVRVVVVDDQAPFRDAARAVIARIPGFALVAEATSGEGAIELVRELRPSLVLMDINMGEIDGIEATRIITTADASTRVILVSTYTEDEMPPSARRCGAMAYVNKDELSPRVVRQLWESGGDPAWLGPEPRQPSGS